MLAASLAVALGFLQAEGRPPAERPIRPEYYLPPSHRPILSEISVSVDVARKSLSSDRVIKLPIPSSYSGQALIGLRTTCIPADAIKSWNLEANPDGLNAAICFTLNEKAEAAVVGYEAQMLTPNEGMARLQRRDIQSWLGPGPVIQSDDPEIISLAKKLKSGTTARGEF